MKSSAKLGSATLTLGLVAIVASCHGRAEFPQAHREAASACPSEPRPPGYNGGGKPGECGTDAECTAGKNGRCQPPSHELSTCSYDACMGDADCGLGKVCNCDGRGNSCVAANCRSDADCAGLGCSPASIVACSKGPTVVGYYCHTTKDSCTDDSDCGKNHTCDYEPAAGRWTCNSYPTCGIG